ncbi:DoxX family protein [Nocardia sp. NPDC005978]|uniref:DoxX family protein n=1 Tax=unclassified Nocardia TaxID=2637762 RepID=UPI0033AE78F0
MNVALWIAAGLLAVVAFAGGLTKTFLPKQKLAAAHGGEWTADFTPGFIKTLGVAELLAALGLILPAVLDILPIMVVVTACAWILLMIGAMRTHARHHQPKLVAVNAIYLALAVFIVVGRLALEPF